MKFRSEWVFSAAAQRGVANLPPAQKSTVYWSCLWVVPPALRRPGGHRDVPTFCSGGRAGPRVPGERNRSGAGWLSPPLHPAIRHPSPSPRQDIDLVNTCDVISHKYSSCCWWSLFFSVAGRGAGALLPFCYNFSQLPPGRGSWQGLLSNWISEKSMFEYPAGWYFTFGYLPSNACVEFCEPMPIW